MIFYFSITNRYLISSNLNADRISIRAISPWVSAVLSAIAQHPTGWRWKILTEEGCCNRPSGASSVNTFRLFRVKLAGYRHSPPPLPPQLQLPHRGLPQLYCRSPTPSLISQIATCCSRCCSFEALLHRHSWLNEKDMIAFVLVSGSLWIILGEFWIFDLVLFFLFHSFFMV